MNAAGPVVREVVLATLAAAAWLFVIDRAAELPWLAPNAGALVAAGFLGIPLIIARWRRLPGDVLGLDGPLRRCVGIGLLASVVVLPLFAVGFDTVQTRIHHARRGMGPGIASAGLEFQDVPDDLRGRVVVYEDARGLAVDNRSERPVQVRPACCAPRVIAPGGRTLLAPDAARRFELTDSTGRSIEPPALAGAGSPLEQPVEAAPGLGWLGWLLLGQIVVIAVPEEAFFRGYLLGRLRTVLPPRRRLLGVPFGSAHVLSAALFAAVHLVATPSPARLLVFFPGLLFAWLAERSGSAIAPAVHHALANITLRLLQRLYG